MRPASGGNLGLEPLRHQGLDRVDEIGSSTEYAPSAVMHHDQAVGRSSRARAAPSKRRTSDYVHAVLLALAVALSIAIVGMLARALVFYNASANSRVVMKIGIIMAAWPVSRQYFLTPTYLLLSAATASAAFGVLAMVWIFIVSKRVNRPNLGRIPIIGSTAAVVGIFISALVLFKVRDGTSGLYGWSCEYQHVENLHENNIVGLKEVCISMTATWYMGIVVAALELVMLSLLVRAMMVAPKTHRSKIRSFAIGRSGYKGLGDLAKVDSDTVPMIERPRSH